MSCVSCSVIPVDRNWFVEHGKTSHGPYMSNEIALRVATAEALSLHRQGQRSRISVHDSFGKVSAEYCLGQGSGDGRRVKADIAAKTPRQKSLDSKTGGI